VKSKPRGPKFRNLSARSGVIYYEREAHGRRVKISTKTASWEDAAAFRELYEQAKGIGRVPFFAGEVPALADFAKRYLVEDTAHLAETTRKDRENSYLAPAGRLLRTLGPLPLDEITAARMREWWNAEIQATGLSIKTGRSYLDALSGVLGYAQDLGLLDSNPVRDFRESLRRRARSKSGRAEAEAGRQVRPIEQPAEIEALLDAAHEEGRVPRVLVLTLLDAGLRLGEVLGLRWGRIAWGTDENDPGRALIIDGNRPRGGMLTGPKSGRARRVALSRRLRFALAELYHARFKPSPEALVFEGVAPSNFRHREWRRILGRAGIGHRAMKDLRDTFASQLLTAGVQLGYVSQQLGHADVAVTARHYARWAGGDSYRQPMTLVPGEVPADLLARLIDADSHQSPTTTETAGSASPLTTGRHDQIWRAQQDSNLRPSGPQTAEEARRGVRLRLVHCNGLRSAA